MLLRGVRRLKVVMQEASVLMGAGSSKEPRLQSLTLWYFLLFLPLKLLLPRLVRVLRCL